MERDQRLSIGELSRHTACKVQTIRYYEAIGIMPEPARTSGNQRRYGVGDLQRLAFIRHSRELGFKLDAIRDLLNLSDTPDSECETADIIARGQLREIESRIVRLNALKKELRRMVDSCAGGRVADCQVIQILADHSMCLSANHPRQD